MRRPLNSICLFTLVALALANPLQAAAQSEAGSLREREFTVSKKYLVLPMRDRGQCCFEGGRDCILELAVEGKKVRYYECDIAPDRESVEFYAYFTLDAYKSKRATVSVRGVAKWHLT